MNTKSKKSSAAQPTRHHINVLGQLLKYIPRSIVNASAREHGIETRARTFSIFSHMAAMIFVQLAHALSLNDVCDWLPLKVRAIAGLGITPPSRNNLSNSNKTRDAKFIETVFWRTLGHLQRCEPAFGGKRKGRRLLHRFKANVHAVDSTTMELVANCMDWAKHRRRKAAAKLHLRLGLNSFLPTFAIVDTAGEHDNKRARWDIEVFFKQVKQTLKLGDFLGHSANAIRWQVWTALLVYVLLRFAAHLGRWGHSFTRLFAVVRAAMWERLDLVGLLRSYGTAGGSFTLLGSSHAAWLPGFEPPGASSHGTTSA